MQECAQVKSLTHLFHLIHWVGYKQKKNQQMVILNNCTYTFHTYGLSHVVARMKNMDFYFLFFNLH